MAPSTPRPELLLLCVTLPSEVLHRQKQKERLLELEDEVEKLAQLSQGARSERAALLERNLKLKVCCCARILDMIRSN
jgi:hypothetical protein